LFDKNLWREAQANRFALLLTATLGVLGGGATIGQAYFLSRIVNAVFLRGQSLAEVMPLVWGLLTAVTIRTLLAAGQDTASHRIAVIIKADLRRRLLAHIHAFGPIGAHDERTGELTAVLTNGIDALEAYFSQYLPQLLIATLVPFAVLVIVFPTDWLTAVIFLITAPLIPLFMVLIGRFAETLTQQQWGLLSQMSAHFLDVLQGLTTLKILGRSAAQAKNIARITRQYQDVTMGALRIAFISALALELLSTLSVAIVAVAIGLRLLNGGMTFGAAFFVLILAPEFYLPLRMLGQRFHAGMDGTAAAQRIFEILDRPAPEMEEDTAVTSLQSAAIQLENVSYAYSDDRPALHDINLTIEPGQHVALVGVSGAGKSAIANLLLGFITPDNGRLLISAENGTRVSRMDTVKPSEATKSASTGVHLPPNKNFQPATAANWRGQIAWVPQTPYLFHDTIAANMRLGRPSANQTDIIAAAQAARIHDFIASLPDGYETVIGERGARLSGGQAQRLALARAFLQDAPFLILDEPTAHLDPATEADLQAATKTLLNGRTALIIAHRLNTIAHVDNIVVLDNGRIVQTGTHNDLIQQDGVYKKLAEEPVISNRLPAITHQPSAISHHTPPAIRHAPSPTPHAPFRHLLTLLKPYQKRIALSVLLGAVTIGSSIGLLATSSYLISAAALQPSIAELGVAIVGVRFFGLTRGVFRYLERLVSHGVTFRLLARLRVWFYEAIEPLAPARLQQFRSGDLLARVVADIDTLQNFFLRVVSPPIVALLIALGVGGWTAVFDIRLALILWLFLALAGVGTPLLTGQLSRRLSVQAITLRAQLNTQIVDATQGLADLMAFGQDARFRANTHQTSLGLTAVQKKMAGIHGLHAGLSVLFSNGGMAAMLIFAIPLVSNGQIDGVYLAGLALASLAAFEAVQPLPLAAQQLSGSLEAARRLLDLVNTQPTVIPPANPAPPPAAPAAPAAPALTLQNVAFSYDDNLPALENVSFDLPPGKRLAIVGPSGAGKTTLLNLLLRFWEFDDGEMRVNGRSLRAHNPDDIRRLFGVIRQNTYLFNGSIHDNLLLARPDANMTTIEAAAQAARIHNFIASLPDGYQTGVGELGLQLSGGERQRLAIARALLQDAPILLLDEPTANLDAITAGHILDTILNLANNRSLLLITHRLTGLEVMDEILVLENGRVVERGQHHELLTKRGLYYRLWQLQNSIFNELGIADCGARLPTANYSRCRQKRP
jgi:ATP-binding cassette subfamily C protein CydCD